MEKNLGCWWLAPGLPQCGKHASSRGKHLFKIPPLNNLKRCPPAVATVANQNLSKVEEVSQVGSIYIYIYSCMLWKIWTPANLRNEACWWFFVTHNTTPRPEPSWCIKITPLQVLLRCTSICGWCGYWSYAPGDEKKVAYFEMGCVARKSSVCFFLVGRHCEHVKSTKTKWKSYHSSKDFHILVFPTWHVWIRYYNFYR